MTFRVVEARDSLVKSKDGIFDIVDLFEEAKIKVTLDLLVNLDKRIEVSIYLHSLEYIPYAPQAK